FARFVMAFGQPLGLLLLTILDIPVSALYMYPEFRGHDWDDACMAIGPSWSVRLWSLGHYLNAILGIHFLGHLTLGADMGEPIIAMGEVMHIAMVEVMQPDLHFGLKLLATCLLLFIIAIFVDNFVHDMRHRRSGTRCSINDSRPN